ncbi:MAG: hypothetical protein GW856_05815 [Cyanobacteria bacterium]|nr:hypothetical protein [Cyanobacteria bacterium CG_2015-16_32_12]NCO77268.1 hypothetical protein [Cyanobacteria bacterium CG_2015-22_32_23]NCQ05431.1 hypothetical protein [Cyanobacteria bacterium CG_2015-09_32_10]NCS85092.1 hypothetical protein [Cyanobacteria bacterium CG_2015-02_32_10]
MRPRRIRKKNHPEQNLDSFLDILTNTVGVLMFIGLFVSLLAAEAGTIIRTPLRSQTNKQPLFFEVRNNKIFSLNDPKLDSEINQVLATLPNCKTPDIPKDIPSYLYSFYLQEIQDYEQCIKTRNIKLDNFYYDNGDYLVSFTEDGALKYEANSSSQGEDSKQLKMTNSSFINTLKQLNPDVNYIAFIVRPDSFETFRVAREKAWSIGYEVGWEPFAQDKILVFGSGGRSVGVQ